MRMGRAPPEAVPALARSTAGRLTSIEGVNDLHDLHVWTLTSSMEVMSVHLLVAPGSKSAQALESAQRLLRDEFSITHATIQVETAEGSCGETHW